jgi:hypothetical protein
MPLSGRDPLNLVSKATSSSYRTLNPGAVSTTSQTMEEGQFNANNQRTHGGIMNRFCLPLAATPSSVSMSAFSTRFAKSMAPRIFEAIRAGVTDLGSVTMFLATVPWIASQSQFICCLIMREATHRDSPARRRLHQCYTSAPSPGQSRQ